ncbi:MAG: hypothetical protein FWD49_00730 [Firmicutes bacterium]|nr:hypothetical protein [Bacillota bacterium]
MKKFFKVTTLLLVLVFAGTLILTACNDGNPNSAISDDDYTLTIKGYLDDGKDLVIKKSVIKEFYAENPDKRAPEDGERVAGIRTHKVDGKDELITYEVSGVYLDDILALYGEKTASDFDVMTVISLDDGYENILKPDIFDTTKGGVKMIIALFYEGEELTQESQSGALRAVFPTKANNAWAKHLCEIRFGETAPMQDATTTAYFMETLTDFVDTFSKGNAWYSGVSISALLDAGILADNEDLYMFITGFDEEEDYLVVKNYLNYASAFLTDKISLTGENGQYNALAKSPVFDGADYLNALKISNTAFLTLGKTALVSFAQLAERHANAQGDLKVSDILTELNMPKTGLVNYEVKDTNGEMAVLTADIFNSATIKSEGGNFVLTHANGTLNIASFVCKEFSFLLDILDGNGELLRTITTADLNKLKGTVLTVTSGGGAVTEYLGYDLGQVLTTVGVRGTFTSITVIENDGGEWGRDITTLNGAFISVGIVNANNELTTDANGPRYIGGLNVGGSSTRSRTAKIRLEGFEPAPLPIYFDDIEVNIEIVHDGNLLFTIKNEHFAGITPTVLIATDNNDRHYFCYSIEAILAKANVDISALDFNRIVANGKTSQGDQNQDRTYTASSLANTYISVAFGSNASNITTDRVRFFIYDHEKNQIGTFSQFTYRLNLVTI